MSLETWIAFIVPIVLIVIYNKTKGVPHGEEEEEAESALTIMRQRKYQSKQLLTEKLLRLKM